jgi:hypothetical protein
MDRHCGEEGESGPRVQPMLLTSGHFVVKVSTIALDV